MWTDILMCLKKVIMQLYQIPDVIFQVDASCVDKFRYRSFHETHKEGQACVLGSDCHNMGTRKPDYIKGIQYLGKNLIKSPLISYYITCKKY